MFLKKGPRSLFMPPILLQSSKSLKSLKFSPIVQTLCAKDGNQYIFTLSSLEGDLSPYKRSFWREFRVVARTL